MTQETGDGSLSPFTYQETENRPLSPPSCLRDYHIIFDSFSGDAFYPMGCPIGIWGAGWGPDFTILIPEISKNLGFSAMK